MSTKKFVANLSSFFQKCEEKGIDPDLALQHLINNFENALKATNFQTEINFPEDDGPLKAVNSQGEIKAICNGCSLPKGQPHECLSLDCNCDKLLCIQNRIVSIIEVQRLGEVEIK